MEENNTNNNTNTSNKIGIIIIIILLIILMIIGLYLIKGKNGNKENNDNNDTNNNQEVSNNIKNGDDRYLGSSLNKQEGTVISENTTYLVKRINKDLAFYYNDKEVSRYNCESEKCAICLGEYGGEEDGSQCHIGSNVDKIGGTYLIVDGFINDNDYKNRVIKKLVLINPEKNIIYNEYNNLSSVIRFNDDVNVGGNNEGYLYLFNYLNKDKNLIVDLEGNTIKNLKDRELLVSSSYSRPDYSSYNLIVTNKNGKYGIESLSSDKVIVENTYEDVRLFDRTATIYTDSPSFDIYNNKYFKAKENGKWYLFDINTSKKVLDKGFDRLYLLDNNTMFVYENGYFSFINYEGNELTSDKIEVSKLGDQFYSQITEGVSITKEGNIINILLSGQPYDNMRYQYNYDLQTHELKKLD